jgi:nickel/cobalt transporter (NicO) family protein
VGLLAMTAGASAGNLPGPAVLCLPLLFAAGMTAMDTTDGVFMCKAYDWAFLNPLRKIFYNVTTTGLSVAVALLVGTIELSQVLIGALDLHGPLVDFIARLDFGLLGYLIVGLFLAAWGLSVALWKFGRIEQRYSIAAIVAVALAAVAPGAARADTVASLLGNFTINQYCGLKLGGASLGVHYVVVFGQLPALRELHNADANGDGVTSQAERDAYVGKLAPGLAEDLEVRFDGTALPLRATHWTSSLPTEQGGFSLRVDVDFNAALPHVVPGTPHRVEFTNRSYAGRLGWHEIAVEAAPKIFVYDTNAYANSLTGGLREALQALPRTGPLDERAVHMTFNLGSIPAAAIPLAARSEALPALPAKLAAAPGRKFTPWVKGAWLARATESLVASISAPRLEPGVAVLALLGALALGAVHALSPGHGKTIVGAYLIGSRGTPRHAAFLGLTVTMTHTALVFILGFATLYASRFMVPERLFPVLSLLSALLVVGLGLVLLARRVRAARHSLPGAGPPATPVFHAVQPSSLMHLHSASTMHSHAGGLMHSHGGGAMHSHLPPGAAGDRITWQSMLALGVSGGLVPCPSAMVLLLAAVALNKTAYGMLLVLAFSVGLALSLTVVGLAFLYAGKRFPTPAAARWPHLLPVMSAGAITALGAALCCGALMSFG